MLGGIRRLLEDEVETVVMVADEASLYDALAKFSPDVVVADLSLPVATATNIAWALKTTSPQTKVVILSIHGDKSVVDEVMTAGVEGFVVKHRTVIDLIPAIRSVLQGGKYISPEGNRAS